MYALAYLSGTKHKAKYSGHDQYGVQTGFWENQLKRRRKKFLHFLQQQDGAGSTI